jgi:hypothetical protein
VDIERTREIEKRPLAGAVARGLALAGVIAMASVLALASPASAEATDWEPLGPGVSPPPASQDVESASIQAVSPRITPAARRVRYVSLINDYSCPLGNLCVAVWDPTRLDYKVFDLYNCNLYHLSNWSGYGSLRNNQTGNVLTTFYDENYNETDYYRPDYPKTHYGFWNPIWHIRNC